MTAETPNPPPVESTESTVTTSNADDTVKNEDEVVTLQGDEEHSTIAPPDPLSEVDEGTHEHDDVSDAHEHTDDESDDFFEGVPLDTTEIDATHSRIKSMKALNLGRFEKLTELCLRNNQITRIDPGLPSSLVKIDLYDNLIHRVQNLEHLENLTSLDLSYNKIKHIKGVKHLKKLKELYFVQNGISRIEELDGLINLFNLELGANRIREIQGLDSLKALEELWLGKNKITQLKGLSNLSSLRVLALPSNRLTEIPLDALSALDTLEELYLSFNDLTVIQGLDSNTRLRTLDISNNRIAHLTNLRHLKQLEEFWANSNLLDSFQEVEEELGGLENLHTVYFEHNPLQKNAGATYRNKVRLSLKSIKQIDATFVTAQ